MAERNNPKYPEWHCFTVRYCDKCGELYEPICSLKHICKKQNSYPVKEKRRMTMAYIDLKVATNAIGNIDTSKVYDDKDDIVEQAISILDHLPSADVVEVVRCKNCKHYEIHKPSVTLNCERNGRLISMMPDDFCSYGERQVNNEN